MYFLSTFCGVCLTDRREVQNINNKDTDDISLVEKLKYCSFKTAWIDDDLPLFICYKCYNDLKIAYAFKKMCASNSTILKGYVSRLKCGGRSADDHECRQLMVEIEKNKIYGVNILLYERVQVEQVDMDVSSSEDESSLDVFEDADMDIKEETVQIKAEYNEKQEQCSENEVVKQNVHLHIDSELEDEIIDIKEESIAEADKDICFVEVKHELNTNLCPEPEHILPDIHSGSSGRDGCNVSANLSASQSTKPSSGGEVNLLNIINEQISHFLTADGKNTSVQQRKVAEKSTNCKPTEVSTLRSLLEASTVAQSHVMQSFEGKNDAEQANDDIQCISSDSDSPLSNEHSQYQSTKSPGKSRYRFKRKLNVSSTNHSLPSGNNVTSSTTLQPPSLSNIIESQQFINTVLSSRKEPATYPDVTQRYPVITENINTGLPGENYLLPHSYPAEPTNTFLIIYDDINPPAAPLVASAKATNSFILPKASVVQNTVPFDRSTDVNSGYVVPSAAPLVINSDTNSGYMLPTSSYTFHNEYSRFVRSHFVQETSVTTQNLQSCSYNNVLPTVADETSPDSETSEPSTGCFSCPVCKKTFGKKKYLTQHFETHYSVTHKCSVCAHNFMDEKTFKAHMLMHNGGEKYTCDYCCKVFAELSEFKRHSSIHVGVKQFECSVCEKRFVKRSSLTKHLASHNDGQSHKCTLCSQAFQYRCRLDHHMMKQHNLK